MATSDSVRIRRIRVSNFRSFAPTPRSRFTPNEDLSSINLFVGPNGGGKSNFFNAIRWCIGWHSFNSQGTYDLEHNYNDSSKPIEIELKLNISGKDESLSFQCAAGLGRNCWEKRQQIPKNEVLRERVMPRIFPTGLPRQFNESWKMEEKRKDHDYQRICENWGRIRDDAEEFMCLTLSRRCPGPPVTDRFFFDVLDQNLLDRGKHVPALEGSDGQAQFLLLIVKIRILEPGSVVLIEEPDVNMHPGMQKQFLNYLKLLASADGGSHQFLVVTHSPYLMDFAAEESDVELFRVFKNKSGHTEIAPVKNERQNWDLLRDLGHSPADVLQPNGIIWVEGPSDVVYVSSWLEKLDHSLIRGRDYEVIPYGGGNIAHVGVNIWRSQKTPDKIINLFDLNENFAFVVDGDRPPKSGKGKKSLDELLKSFAQKQAQKHKVIENCRELGKYFWKVDDCIEACLRNSFIPKHHKPERAIEHREEIKPLSKAKFKRLLKHRALQKLNDLVKEIRSWRTTGTSTPNHS
jgi:predicted ATP-dependent endonuclease of OLD family